MRKNFWNFFIENRSVYNNIVTISRRGRTCELQNISENVIYRIMKKIVGGRKRVDKKICVPGDLRTSYRLVVQKIGGVRKIIFEKRRGTPLPPKCKHITIGKNKKK